MGCNGGCNRNPCACNEVPLPYYEDACFQENQCQGTRVVNQFSAVIRVATEWAVPEADNVITLKVPALVDMLIGSYIWNPNYGAYLVVTYDQEGQQIKVTKAEGNMTTVGTVIPACSKFIIVSATDSDILELEERVEVLESEVNDLQADVDTLETSVTTIEGEITTIEADIVSIESDITTIEADILAIKQVPTGAIVEGFYVTAPTGWVLLVGGSIGSAASGATERANADTLDLYTLLWNSLANAQAPVSSGRGVSALADFNANKTLTLPDCRQRFTLGQSAAGTGSTLGDVGGNIDHTHSVPAHYHGMGSGADLNITASGSHLHTINSRPSDGTVVGGFFVDAKQSTQNIESTSTNSEVHTHASGDFAGRIGLVTGGVNGNSAMTSGSNNPPFLVVTKVIKL